MIHSLEAKHLIWVWIMKVKGSKNQVDFIEVLYVVVNAWGASFNEFQAVTAWDHYCLVKDMK